jgi:hypothetical protein
MPWLSLEQGVIEEGGARAVALGPTQNRNRIHRLSIETFKKINSVALRPSSELYRPSDRRMSAKLVPTFADRVVAWSAQRIPTAVNIGFLDRSRYFSIQVAPQLASRG